MSGDGNTLSIVIKNADGVTTDFVLRDTPLDGTRIHALKCLLREQYPGQPEEGSMKLVHSGRLLKDNELLTDVIQLQDLSVPPVFHLLVREGSSRSLMSTPVSRSNSNVSELATPAAPQGDAETPRPTSFGRAWSNDSNTSATPPAPINLTPARASPAAGVERTPPPRHDSPGCCPHHHHHPAPPPPQPAWAVSPPASAAAAVPSPASWPRTPPAYPPMQFAMPFSGAIAQDPAACYELLHRIYYEAYYHTYMAALDAESQATSSAPAEVYGSPAGAAWAGPGAPGAAAVANAPRCAAPAATDAARAGFGAGAAAEPPAPFAGGERTADGMAAAAAPVAAGEPPAAYDAAGGAGEAQIPEPRVHLHAGARGPMRQGVVREDGGDGGRNVARAEGGALRLALKLVFVVFLLGQDAPKERLYTLCCIALCIFLHQVGLLQPLAWLQARPAPGGGGMGGMGDVRADNDADGAGGDDDSDAMDGDGATGLGGGGGGRAGGGAGAAAAEERGLMGDVGALIVAFFTSLVPTPLAHEPPHGLAN